MTNTSASFYNYTQTKSERKENHETLKKRIRKLQRRSILCRFQKYLHVSQKGQPFPNSS